jgi:RHS repeat-associated protein
MTYDARRRLSTAQTYRGAPALWSQQPATYSPAPSLSGPPTTLQRLLADSDFHYDAVDNPIEIDDWRDPSEWPAGAQPVTRKMQYDDLYRLSRIDYQYASGADPWTDPFDAEDTGTPSEQDPRRAAPSPHLSFTERVLSQTFQYNWLGNTAQTGDDAGGFYDRSIGTITNGAPTAGPYQLQSATGGAAPRDGSLTTSYDAAGDLVGLSVARNAAAPCLPTGAACSQFFAYDWDEVGRLVRARRWDGASLGVASGPLPRGATAVDLQYAYDGNDDRVIKTAVDSTGNALYTVYVADSLELRRTTFDGADFARDVWTEVPYLFANGERLARVHYATDDVPTLTNGNLHVLLEVEDFLGSTTIVVDQATAELVEAGTYEAYGATESDYRPERWDSYREDYRFTGKEEDVEVGLEYFGKRYYAPGLGRWVSPDPLAVHGLGADGNVYAYVRGRALVATDPIGLECDVDTSCADTDGKELNHSTSDGNPPPPPPKADPLTLRSEWVGACADPGEGGSCSGLTPLAPDNSTAISNGSARVHGSLTQTPDAPPYDPSNTIGGLVHEDRPPVTIRHMSEGEQKDQEFQIVTQLMMMGVASAVAFELDATNASVGVSRTSLSTVELNQNADVIASTAEVRAPASIGEFAHVNETMPARAAIYQSQVTGRLPDVGYIVDGVKFDGMADNVLLDAKGQGYANFVGKNGQFQPWWRGADSLVSQAQRQVAVAGGQTIEWHFAEESAANATRTLFQQNGIAGISILFSPK